MPAVLASGISVPGAGNLIVRNFAGFVAAGATYVGTCIPASSISEQGCTANNLRLLPFIFKSSGLVTAIVLTNASGTGNARVGLWEMTSSGFSLVVESSSTAIGSSTTHEIDITDTAVSPGKLYLAGVVNDATIGWLSIVASPEYSHHADFPVMQIAATASVGNFAGYTDSHTYGAMPSTLTFASNGNIIPDIKLKVSS